MLAPVIELESIDPAPDIQSAIDLAIIEIGAFLTNIAKNDHRYVSRSGKLRNATRHQTIKDRVKLYIDQNISPYGQFVHDGQRTWAADPFLDNAVRNNQGKIEAILEKHIEKAVQ